MPIYEYECSKCGNRTEVMQSISEPPLEKCGRCSGKLVKQFSPPAIIFKGSGWYATEFPTKDRKEGLERERSGATDKKSEAGEKKKTESDSKKMKKEKVGV